MSAIAALVLEFLYALFVEVLLEWTGELLRFGFTLGRRKPSFALWWRGRDSEMRELVNASLLLGLVFWVVVLAVVTAWSLGS